MKKHTIHFAQTTTIEKLTDDLRPCYDAVLTLGDKVMVARSNYKGQYEAATYEFIDTPDDGFDAIECRLNLHEVADEVFEDNGHAIAWAMAH